MRIHIDDIRDEEEKEEELEEQLHRSRVLWRLDAEARAQEEQRARIIEEDLSATIEAIRRQAEVGIEL